jgi:hypothetical protein
VAGLHVEAVAHLVEALGLHEWQVVATQARWMPGVLPNFSPVLATAAG